MGFQAPQALASAAFHPCSDRCPLCPSTSFLILSCPASPPTLAFSLGSQPVLSTPVLHPKSDPVPLCSKPFHGSPVCSEHRTRSFPTRRPGISRKAPRKLSRKANDRDNGYHTSHYPPPQPLLPDPHSPPGFWHSGPSLWPPSPTPSVSSPSSLRSQLNQCLLQEAFLTSEAGLGPLHAPPCQLSPHL